MVSDNGVLFLDVVANANFADFGDYSSIINTEVDGTTLACDVVHDQVYP